MKRITISLSCLLLCLMVGCSSSSTSKVQDANSPKQPESSAVDIAASTEQTNNSGADADVQSLPKKDKLDSLLASNEHMDIISVSADAKTGIRIEVDNKTNQNLYFMCDSISINRRTISSDNYYHESQSIAPNSIGDVVLSFNSDSSIDEYDFSDITSASGHLSYELGGDDGDWYEISFSSPTA